MTVLHPTTSAQRLTSNQEAHLLLTRLIERMGLNKRGFLERLADLGFAFSDDDFKNWGRAGRSFPHDWAALRAMIQVVTHNQPAKRRCTAVEALQFLGLVGMPFPELQPVARLFTADEFSSALAAYIPQHTGPVSARSSRVQPSLPVPPTSLIGRARDVDMVCTLLQRADVRVLTLTGPPGVGKTRLALRVTEDLHATFADGVRFIGLAPMHDPGLVLVLIAQGLGLTETGSQTVEEQLKEYLREQQMLLVLDNFEQVLAAGPRIAELVQAASRLKVLITSRAVLHVYGEHEYTVPPLELPDLANLPPTPTLLACASVALFIARAQAVMPGFAPTSGHLATIAEICARLDGLPLAIELAAARSKVLTPSAMLARLTSRLTLLTGGARDLPARQQTLRDAITWSYELLDAHEQRLFAQLAVFIGGCTLEAAEAVCTSGEEPQPDLLDILASLVDKSLLQHWQETDGGSRFRMLEMIREFGLEHLERSGMADQLRRQHAAYYMTLAETAEPALRGPHQSAWLRRLEDEHDNVRAVLGWALSAGEVEIAMRLSVVLRRFWYMHGHLGEGRTWLEQALLCSQRHASHQVPQAIRAKALHGAGILAHAQGDDACAMHYFTESLALFRTQGDNHGIAMSLAGLGWIAHARGDFEQAIALHEESLALHRLLEDQKGIAVALNCLGEVARSQADDQRATTYYTESLALFRVLGDTRGTAVVLQNLAQMALQHADIELARARFTDSLVLFHELGSKKGIAECLIGLGQVAGAQGQLEQAVRLWGAMEAFYLDTCGHLDPADHVNYARAIATVRPQLSESVWNTAWSAGRALALEQAIAVALAQAPACGSVLSSPRADGTTPT
jgi:predicted ATPase